MAKSSQLMKAMALENNGESVISENENQKIRNGSKWRLNESSENGIGMKISISWYQRGEKAVENVA
jgi:hypothetical protein